MAHIRKQIRDAVVTRVTGLTTTGSRVYPSRTTALAAGDMPGLQIFTLKEPIRTLDRDRAQLRDLEVMIDACVTAASGTAADTLDTICAEVETAMAATLTVGGVTIELALAETAIELKSEADPSVAVAHMKFIVTAQTAQGTPETPL